MAYISVFVSCGAKFYAAKIQGCDDGTEKYIIKVRGINLNYKNASIINFESVVRLALIGFLPDVENDEYILIEEDDIRRTALHNVITTFTKKGTFGHR